MTTSLDHLRDWMGRTETKSDVATAWPVTALAATLDRRDPDPVLLFRFSALTFNGHRIHYDLDYCRHEESYPGLIVHGPLQTILLLDLCRRQETRPVKKLDYRALHPVFHGERISVNGEPAADACSAQVWTANAAGSMAMAGTAFF